MAHLKAYTIPMKNWALILKWGTFVLGFSLSKGDARKGRERIYFRGKSGLSAKKKNPVKQSN